MNRWARPGCRHLLEHLMFRGTKKLKPEEFSNIIQENGGEDNAFTAEDLTLYFEIINRDHLDVPIALEADRMANFEPKGFDSEKAVVVEERRLRTEDNPQDALEEITQAQAYLAHPYHWPVIGWMHDVQGLTLQDALNYHRIYYSPQNALIVAVGDFKSDAVIKQITETYSSIGNGPKPPPVTAVEPPQEGEREMTAAPCRRTAGHYRGLPRAGPRIAGLLRARPALGDPVGGQKLAAVQEAGD